MLQWQPELAGHINPTSCLHTLDSSGADGFVPWLPNLNSVFFW